MHWLVAVLLLAGDKPPRYVPLARTPQFGPFVRYLQHTNDEVGGGSLSRIVARDMLSLAIAHAGWCRHTKV